MRLLTHNYLQSNVKGTEKGYPLTIEPTKIEYEESPIDMEFVENILTKIDYSALLSARNQIEDRCHSDLGSNFVVPSLPEVMPKRYSDGNSKDDKIEEDETNQEAFLKSIHTILFDIHVLEGHLVCPDTGRRFNIKMGIPNMILHEDEI
mmetsp:Transcript_25437/g.31341  ORF Transcript_25437/g.31341 Transcript_25437/m.31341 type:complete len:149 (+) Transcript_25437:130-576(+)